MENAEKTIDGKYREKQCSQLEERVPPDLFSISCCSECCFRCLPNNKIQMEKKVGIMSFETYKKSHNEEKKESSYQKIM